MGNDYTIESPKKLSGDGGVQSVERVVTLLQLLASAERPARVTELARNLNVHKSTVSRMLATLEGRGFADRGPDGTSFVLGNGVALLAANAARPRSLTAVSRQILIDLAAKIGETVAINVLTDDGDLLIVDQVTGRSGLSGINWVGQQSPAFANAAGKALLAQLSEGDIEALLPEKLPELTPHTLDRPSLLSELPTIRSLGFAICREELELGLSAIAAPVFDGTGAIGGLSAFGPTERILGKSHREIAATVVSAAREMSARLGSRPGAEQFR